MTAIAQKVVAISQPYLGPATESFLARQCKSHLKTDLAAVTQSQMKELAKWVEVSAGLIMDSAKAAELARKLAAL